MHYILIKMEGKGCKRIGDFKITDEVLGKGSFSTVYTAYDNFHNRLAVKVIQIAKLTEEQVTMLQREITILRKCKHQNVVALIDVKKTRNNLYIFMEYCQDGSLEELIQERKKMEEAQALGYFFQILKGMQVLAVNKIIHRDLKPPNLLIKNGKIKIADFGLARNSINNQFMKTFAGSPLHMAPQIIRGDPYTQKVDVYSVGIILYQMLFGNAPFSFSRNDYSELLRAKDRGMRDNKTVRISQNTANLLRKMLQPNPEQRINMNGVLDFMDAYLFNQKEQRLKFYKKMSLQSLVSLGALGSIIGAMNLPPPSSPSVSTMDLRLYGRLCQRLTTVNN